jgi:hypothetical protein
MKQNEELFEQTFADKTRALKNETRNSGKHSQQQQPLLPSQRPKSASTTRRIDLEARRPHRSEEEQEIFEVKKPKVGMGLSQSQRTQRPQRPLREQKSSSSSLPQRLSSQLRPHTSHIQVDETLRRSLNEESDESNQLIGAVLEGGSLTDLSQLLDVIDPMTVQVMIHHLCFSHFH